MTSRRRSVLSLLGIWAATAFLATTIYLLSWGVTRSLGTSAAARLELCVLLAVALRVATLAWQVRVLRRAEAEHLSHVTQFADAVVLALDSLRSEQRSLRDRVDALEATRAGTRRDLDVSGWTTP